MSKVERNVIMRSIDEIKADIAENNKSQLANRFERSHVLITEFLYAVTDEVTLDRLEEICNAERDGRLVVLKNKPNCRRCEFRKDLFNAKIGRRDWCDLLDKDVSQSSFGNNAPRVCPLRIISEALKGEGVELIKCKDCKHLYIKDFATGVCENEKTEINIVNPDDGCKCGEQALKGGAKR